MGVAITRLEGKVAAITGAGQTRGDSISNGRAAALLFAREGARLLLANRRTASLDETVELLRKEGFDAECLVADVSNEDDCAAPVKTAVLNISSVASMFYTTMLVSARWTETRPTSTSVSGTTCLMSI